MFVSLISLFFLILPVLLMIWMMSAQRRVRSHQRVEPELPHVEPWEETVRTDGRLVYLKRHDPNTELTDAEGRAADARAVQALGIGL